MDRWLSLVGAAGAMGVLGGAHCLAMCAAPCGALTGRVSLVALPGHAVEPVADSANRADGARMLCFQLGRVVGYAAMGALAAAAMGSLAWMSRQTQALQPVWTLLHVAMVVWGLAMLVQARQPVWVERAGRRVWARVQPFVASRGGVAVAGVAWAFMPCALLYSALLVAALSGGVLRGAASMAAFAVGSGLWLLLGPWLWRWGRAQVNGWRAQWGTRLAGLLLMGVAGWALWMDRMHQAGPWC